MIFFLPYFGLDSVPSLIISYPMCIVFSTDTLFKVVCTCDSLYLGIETITPASFTETCDSLLHARSVAPGVSDSLQPYWLEPAKLFYSWDSPGKNMEWLPLPSPGDLPDPGIKPTSLTSPTLAGRFFTHWATWEAPVSTIGTNILKGPKLQGVQRD